MESICICTLQIVKIEFIYFQLDSCWGDTVSLYDGDNDEAPLIVRLCGNDVSEVFISTGPTMYAVFISDSYGQGKGFNASYTALPKQPTNMCKYRFANSVKFFISHNILKRELQNIMY